MKIHHLVDMMIADRRSERMRTSTQLKLGQMIAQLEAIPLTYKDHRGETVRKRIWFSFGRTFPVDLSSWRGSYAELAITFDFNPRTVGVRTWDYPYADDFLARLKQAVGQTFQGYKGGDFTMDESTPLWVANYGDSGNTGVSGVRDMKYEIVIDTAWCEF